MKETGWSDVRAGDINAATQRFWLSLGEYADVVAKRMVVDARFVLKVGAAARSGAYEPSVQQVRARDIMKENIFGVEDAIAHLGVMPHKRHLLHMQDIGFSETVLAICKNTHVLVAYFPMSLSDLRDVFSRGRISVPMRGQWENVVFTMTDCSPGWYLVPKVALTEERPTWACVLAYTMVGHFLATGERMFEGGPVLTADVDSLDRRVTLEFRTDGITIGHAPADPQMAAP